MEHFFFVLLVVPGRNGGKPGRGGEEERKKVIYAHLLVNVVGKDVAGAWGIVEASSLEPLVLFRDLASFFHPVDRQAVVGRSLAYRGAIGIVSHFRKKHGAVGVRAAKRNGVA